MNTNKTIILSYFYLNSIFLSGSSALPERIFEDWRDLTGFEIVEQFGSSETGRVLSNKLDGKKLAGEEII